VRGWRRWRVAAGLLCALAAAPATAARAPDPAAPGPERPPRENEGRRLGGHTFLLSEFLPNPFITTELSSITSLGLAFLHVPIAGTASVSTYDLAAFSQAAQLQLGFADVFALRFGAAANAESGTTPDAALVAGAMLGYAFGGGAALSGRVGRLRLTASFDVRRRNDYDFDIADAIQRSAAAGTVTTATLLVNTATLSYRPGVQLAFALGPASGIIAHVRFDHDSASTAATASVAATSTTLDAVEAGAALSIDLRAASLVPVGLLFSYNRVSVIHGDGSSHQAGAGLFYTGRYHLSVGLEVRGRFQSLAAGTDETTVEGVLAVRYFW
jgi:hypothetical protein